MSIDCLPIVSVVSCFAWPLFRHKFIAYWSHWFIYRNFVQNQFLRCIFIRNSLVFIGFTGVFHKCEHYFHTLFFKMRSYKFRSQEAFQMYIIIAKYTMTHQHLQQPFPINVVLWGLVYLLFYDILAYYTYFQSVHWYL